MRSQQDYQAAADPCGTRDGPCGYLRLPYDPEASLVSTIVTEKTWPIGLPDHTGRGATGKEIRTYPRLPNDRQVRLTIISTINAHLQSNIAVSWEGLDFDFTGTTFDGGIFAGARFSGGRVSFGGATFSGGNVFYNGATFSGGGVSFLGRRSPAAWCPSTFSGFQLAACGAGTDRLTATTPPPTAGLGWDGMGR